MSTGENKVILSADILVDAPVEKVWAMWTTPEDIKEWNKISDEWHNTKIANDIRPGGSFLFAMGLKDGSFKFDFCGVYDDVQPLKLIAYTLDNGRTTRVTFTGSDPVKVTETFEANQNDPIDMQRNFCQAVLARFKCYTEGAA